MENVLASYKIWILEFPGCLPVTERLVKTQQQGCCNQPHGKLAIKDKNGPFSDAISDEDIDDIEKLRVP